MFFVFILEGDLDELFLIGDISDILNDMRIFIVKILV